MADNPLRLGLEAERRPDPFTLIIFGATGDLCRRKLLPALYNLALDGWLPEPFLVIGVGRTAWTDDAFRQTAAEAIDRFSRRARDRARWEAFARHLAYVAGDFQDGDTYQRIGQRLTEAPAEAEASRLFYLATPPALYPVVAERLRKSGLHRSDGTGWVRIIVEKPFGHDLESARALNQSLHQVFGEDQLFRIDHYLGKETVQNLLVFRFANGIFEPLWNQQFIDHVQITVAESIGLEGRGGYYESAGALRDMVQNHMLQLLSLIAMEPPATLDADAIRDEKVKVLKALRPLTGHEVNEFTVRGQYQAGVVDGVPVPGYRQEPDVDPQSNTESYVALRLQIDNWRWAGVPFYLRTGKRLARRVSEIAIQFKRPPHRLFAATRAAEMDPNLLAVKIQPDEGMALRFGAKVPGPHIRVRTVNMEFLYGTSFADPAPEAYERLLLDAMWGDSTLFTRKDEVEVAWAFISGILEGWQRYHTPLYFYEAGSWGPGAADDLIARDALRWRRP
ncbi:MAG: glucose-6-phosphate dehydrogenase [Firmicutes bacterium]|nr:glucose-6-phosphate dehydrogenase [Alicyclobacillaceae bacterium]MCL6496561.1 glucose-6-phosphate dehydrogenase [Bacillota bacterium]